VEDLGGPVDVRDLGASGRIGPDPTVGEDQRIRSARLESVDLAHPPAIRFGAKGELELTQAQGERLRLRSPDRQPVPPGRPGPSMHLHLAG
jgi:hypothetical protein